MAAAGAARTRYKDSAADKGTWSAKIVVIGALIALGVTIYVFASYFQREEAVNVRAETAGFSRISDNALQIQVDVSRQDPKKPAYCIVRAVDYYKAEVGRREFLLGAAEHPAERLYVTIPTRTAAVAASVYGCSESVPPYLTEEFTPEEKHKAD